MGRIEAAPTGAGRVGSARTQPLREAITRAAAFGFLAGGLVRLALLGAGDPRPLMLCALYLPLGAAAAAVVAGIIVNLIALPVLCRVVPGRRLPDATYRAAGALSALAAFASAFAELPPIGA